MGRKSHYSREFMEAAVELLREPGHTLRSVGRDLGVSYETIRKWRMQLAEEDDPVRRRARDEHAELVALRRRVKVLEEEREILSKAAASLGQEHGRTR